MKKAIVLLAAIIALSGCASSKVFVGAVDGYTKVILPEYKKYIQNDPALSDDSKRIRTQTADKFQQLIDEENKRK